MPASSPPTEDATGQPERGLDQAEPSDRPAGAGARGFARRHAGVLQQLLIVFGISAAAWINRHAALPPLHATPIWVPAGLMVLAAVALGWRALPALFLVGVYQGWPTVSYAARSVADGGLGDSTPRVVLAAAMLGMGTAGLGAAAHLFGRRLLRDRPTLSARRALLFLIAVGPVACLVSAGLGVAELRETGILHPANTASSWFVWWSGDALGALLLAPLAVLLQPQPRLLRDTRRSALIAVVVGTTALVAATYALVGHVQTQRVRASFSDGVRADARRVQDHVDAIVTTLDAAHIRVVQHPPLASTPAPVPSDLARELTYLPRDSAPARWARLVARHPGTTAFVDARGARSLASSVRLFEPVHATGTNTGADDLGPLVGFVQQRTSIADLIGNQLRRKDRHVVVQVGHGQRWLPVTPATGNLVDPDTANLDSPEQAAASRGVVAVVRTPVRVLDQHWNLVAGADDQFISGQSFSAATVPLSVLSFVLALFVGTIVLVLSGARALLELEILQRTRQLRQSEQRYRHVVETSEQGIVHVDAGGIVTFANRAWPLVVGSFADEDPVGQHLSRYLDADSARSFDVTRVRILQGESNVETLELRVAAGAGHARVELVAMPFELDDDTPGILVTITAVPQHRTDGD